MSITITEKTKKYGFTLAEVLITLVIIGVVAAMTIPNISTTTGKKEYVQALKKVNATLSNITNYVIMRDGKANKWATSVDNIAAVYKENLNILKDCAHAAGCHTIYPLERSNSYKFVLTDGTMIMIEKESSCAASAFGSTNFCATFYVDVNGERKPNKIGVDNFGFVLKKNGVYPMGCDTEAYKTASIGTVGGYARTCKVIETGEINF